MLRMTNVRLPEALEERLRKFTPRKGDLSRILAEAVELWLAEHEPKPQPVPEIPITQAEQLYVAESIANNYSTPVSTV